MKLVFATIEFQFHKGTIRTDYSYQDYRFYRNFNSIKVRLELIALIYLLLVSCYLLVEDNELNREIAVEIIGSTGITINTAINGLDAVHKVAQSEEGFYQIILMDIQMPIMDGYEATRQIRSLQRRDIAHMPIIAMTANAFSEDVTNAIKAGMNYHLAKPIDIGALMGILSKYLQAPA